LGIGETRINKSYNTFTLCIDRDRAQRRIKKFTIRELEKTEEAEGATEIESRAKKEA